MCYQRLLLLIRDRDRLSVRAVTINYLYRLNNLYICSLTESGNPTHPALSLTHSLTHSLTPHSLTHSLTHLLTYLLTYLLDVWVQTAATNDRSAPANNRLGQSAGRITPGGRKVAISNLIHADACMYTTPNRQFSLPVYC